MDHKEVSEMLEELHGEDRAQRPDLRALNEAPWAPETAREAAVKAPSPGAYTDEQKYQMAILVRACRIVLREPEPVSAPEAVTRAAAELCNENPELREALTAALEGIEFGGAS